MPDSSVDVGFLKRRIKDIQENESSQPLQTGDGGGRFDGMNERLAKLEGAFDGLKQSQAVMVGAVAIVSALLLGSTLYLVTRVDVLGSQVNEVPGKVATELRELNKTLLQAVTAAKQQPPQVIVYPVPLQAVDHSKPTDPHAIPTPQENK